MCALDAEATKARFASTQDAAKSHNYCGDAAYVAALLSALGLTSRTQLTMTNKIKEVELVWTLGAMLAKSAELAGGAPPHPNPNPDHNPDPTPTLTLTQP